MPKTSAPKKVDRIAVRVDDDMPMWLNKRAQKARESVSGVVRRLIRDAMTTGEAR